ncbi:MAG TPA: hypothetical protein VFU47_17400 [Armatimonadota bacterium]|nr:hypothetical protein [Armatimonadota bacterium]
MSAKHENVPIVCLVLRVVSWVLWIPGVLMLISGIIGYFQGFLHPVDATIFAMITAGAVLVVGSMVCVALAEVLRLLAAMDADTRSARRAEPAAAIPAG